MVWYGIVWYDIVWYGMVWYGMVWYGMVWYGMVCARRDVSYSRSLLAVISSHLVVIVSALRWHIWLKTPRVALVVHEALGRIPRPLAISVRPFRSTPAAARQGTATFGSRRAALVLGRRASSLPYSSVRTGRSHRPILVVPPLLGTLLPTTLVEAAPALVRPFRS